MIGALLVACGGCFTPPDVVTAVDGHRMVVALSAQRTTLWDQIRYQGAPEDFVWVLPVPDPSAEIQLASPSFFDELDAQSAPQVQPLDPFPCGQPSAQAAECGGSVPVPASDDSPPVDGVTVFDESTVGPYQTATIGSESATALYEWLNLNGYNVPESTIPIIEWYVEQRSVFVALQLAPGEGVNAMQPVRVRYPGYMASFPLKMVTVGAVGTVELALWVIAEQRFEASNYATVVLDETKLVWDWATNTSSYDELFLGTIDEAGGRAWVVEHAAPLANLSFGEDAQGDVQVATNGLPYAYVTRLRTDVLVDHLDEDLALRPAADAADVSNFLFADLYANQPMCRIPPGERGGGCRVGLPRRVAATAAPLVVALLALVWLRRRP
jgi:hypothetical protein